MKSLLREFDEQAQKAIVVAESLSFDFGHQNVGSEHLLLSILKKDNIVSRKLKDYGITYDSFRQEVVKIIGVGNSESDYFVYTPLLKKVIENSIILSKEQGNKEVTLECLFLSLLDEGEGVAVRILLSFNVDIDTFYDEINKSKKIRKNKKNLLVDEYGLNLNNEVIANNIDPVIGRENEVQRVIEILCRRTKNNPLLIGDAGVGKTAVIEEIARKIVDGEVPNKLLNKRVVSVSMASLVSGTKYRGEFEERVTKLLNEIEEVNDVIVFIDEIHTLVGAGGAEGAIDASNILKPALARGKINVIGATTTEEYKKFIENDKALSRRFQTVIIDEPNNEKVTDILMKLKPIYEKYHKVVIDDEIIKLIVKLSDKYLYNRKNPDKAIDVLDEVCAKVAIKEDEFSKRSNYYKGLLKTIKTLKNNAVLNSKFEEALYLREEEMKLESCINKLDVKIMKTPKEKKVTKDIVAEVIKSKGRVPVYEILKPTFVVKELMDTLKKSVIGQDAAIKVLTDATRGIIYGYKYDNKPLSFLFVGPTGVGKTLLAKEYHKFLFGNNNIIRLDMSEYREEYSVSKIIGSPPGYVGYENKNNLLEEVKNRPYSVILLDEVEKAHPAVLNLFLQIMDEGMIKDSSGNTFRFDNTIIIMTSNAGASSQNIGFLNNSSQNKDSLNKYFSLELLNRIQNIIYFNKLNENDIKLIIEMLFNKFSENVSFDSKKISPELILNVINKSEYEKFGARKLEKIIFSEIENLLFDDNNSKVAIN